MRPLVLLLALCALLIAPACESDSGPSSALDVQPDAAPSLDPEAPRLDVGGQP